MKKAIRLKGIIGVFRGKKDVARNHDKYLIEDEPRKNWSKSFKLMKKRKENKDLLSK
ncbi:MAG: hypothetical protein LHV68_07325 [Elusimicrobia bacterium]|nr:hypothetical protein [Candidatus Liberimonas magnetica]